MIVYKFGGASVKDADSIKRLYSIVSNSKENLIIVVSAMGKTTNKLERIVALKMKGSNSYHEALIDLMNEHIKTMKELFGSGNNAIFDIVYGIFAEISKQLEDYNDNNYDFIYDKIVSAGEILSTRIVSAYLSVAGIKNRWIDIRKHLKTGSEFREGTVDMIVTENNIKKAFDFANDNIYVTQGFIGSDSEGNTTTLGREGSDYSATLIASILDAGKVILWKDVDGVFNSDPKLFKDAKIMKELSYHEAIELSFYGAKIIHPKTIKPAQNKNIPVFIKNFKVPDTEGSVIRYIEGFRPEFPVFIVKNEQILISVTPKDYSFVVEKHLSRLFSILNKLKIKVNLMQNSAVSFSVCCDKMESNKLKELLSGLKNEFRVLYNKNLELITIRHYNDEGISRMLKGKQILIEQRSRNTIQFVVK